MVCQEICPSTQIRLCGGKELTVFGGAGARSEESRELHGSVLSNGPHSQWTGQSYMSLVLC